MLLLHENRHVWMIQLKTNVLFLKELRAKIRHVYIQCVRPLLVSRVKFLNGDHQNGSQMGCLIKHTECLALLSQGGNLHGVYKLMLLHPLFGERI